MAKTRKSQSRARREESELENAYRSISRSGKKSKKNKKTHRTAGIAAISVALIAIVLFIAAGYFYFMKADLNGIILDNVTVAGVDVGGMRQADAITLVNAATQNTYSQKPMEVTVLEHSISIPTNCVGPLDVRGAVRAAYKFGNSGSQAKRQEEQKIAMTTGYAVDLTPYLNIKESNIRTLLEQLGDNYNTTLNQSEYEVTGQYPQQTLVIKLGTPEYGLNLDELYEKVLKAYSNNEFQVQGSCGMHEPTPIDLEAISAEYYIEPVDAAFDPKTYEIVEGKAGYGLNVEEAKKRLKKAPFGSTVEIPFEEISPAVTAESLQALLYRDTLATYTAKADSNPDRNVNLRLACEAINGLVLNPKEVFSYNDTLGERTAQKGYRPAASYENGKTVMTYGGGVCQVSSALYYCTLLSEMEILVRENHGYYPGYVPLGMDATVSWGSVDFRFRNASAYPIRIEAEASGGTVTVKIIGTEVRDYRAELEYEEISKTDYTVTYQTMPANNPEGYKDGQYIQQPYAGYKVKTYLCKYDKSTGELLSKDFLEQSNYNVQNGVVCKIEGGGNSGDNFGGGNISDLPGLLP